MIKLIYYSRSKIRNFFHGGSINKNMFTMLYFLSVQDDNIMLQKLLHYFTHDISCKNTKNFM